MNISDFINFSKCVRKRTCIIVYLHVLFVKFHLCENRKKMNKNSEKNAFTQRKSIASTQRNIIELIKYRIQRFLLFVHPDLNKILIIITFMYEAVAKLQFLQQQPLKNACFAAFRRENAGAWAKN